MTYQRHFIIEGKHLGIAPCSMEFVHEELQRPRSYAYFCPVCGELWAKCPVEVVATGEVLQWMTITTNCRKHPQGCWRAPGSLSLNYEEAYSTSFPDEVVRWEFQRQMDYFNSRNT